MDTRYRGLPVLLVSSWDEVTPTSLIYALQLFA